MTENELMARKCIAICLANNVNITDFSWATRLTDTECRAIAASTPISYQEIRSAFKRDINRFRKKWEEQYKGPGHGKKIKIWEDQLMNESKTWKEFKRLLLILTAPVWFPVVIVALAWMAATLEVE